MQATGGGTMTRFRQVTSPASGLLRSVLLGNRLKSDRLLEVQPTDLCLGRTVLDQDLGHTCRRHPEHGELGGAVAVGVAERGEIHGAKRRGKEHLP